MGTINNKFWDGKLVLVTGAGGFIGSHLVRKLSNLGCRVRAFVRYNSANSYGMLKYIEEQMLSNVEIITGDILDESSLKRATVDVDTIFHLAAIPSIPYSFQNPGHVFMVNMNGVVNLLMSARDTGVRKVILASSAGASERRPLLSPYIASKAAMEKVGLGFNMSFGLDVCVMRLMNNYGPGQSARAIIPTIISQALVKDDIHLGSLDPKMDFNYVEDSVVAFLKTAENEKSGGKILTWGTGISTSVKDLAELIFTHIGRTGLHIVTDKERIRPVPESLASLNDDIYFTQEFLNYVPSTDLSVGITNTIEWISDNISNYRTDIYNI